METVKRIWNFDEGDIDHMRCLFKNLFKQFFIGVATGNMREFVNTWFWIKLHCTCDSEEKID